jgi:LysM repeat protein
MRRLSRLTRCLGLALTLVAAGCFQPAGTSIDGAASQPTVESIPIQPTSEPAMPESEPTALPMVEGEPTALPMVENTGVPVLIPSSTPIFTPTETPRVEILNIETIVAETRQAGGGPTATPEPTDPNAALTPQIITATVVYITPSAPEGPVVLPSATARPSSTPTPEGFAASTATESESPFVISAEGCFYIVQSGDSLYAIAVRNGLALDALREANPEINPQALQIGQQLRLPTCVDTPTPTATFPPTQTLPPGVEPTATATPQGVEYVVRPGDTLSSIATRFRVTVNAIVRANPALQANPNLLSIGQRLIIPVDPTPAPASSTPTLQATPPGSVIEPVILPSATGFGG